MRHSTGTEEKKEARMLGGIALLCYSTTLAAMLVLGYTLIALTLRGVAVQDFVVQTCPCF
jgi:hypothetical protein